MKKIVFTFGRMNPFTYGHYHLAQVLDKTANKFLTTHNSRIYLSHTQNSTKDPLSYDDKIKYAKVALKFYEKIQVTKSKARTVIEVAKELESEGFTDIVLVVGSDRVREFKTLLEKYNGKEYTFNSINVVSAGERDPDAEGVSGFSASKVRSMAVKGDLEGFKKAVPYMPKKAEELYNKIRKGMKLTEMNVQDEEKYLGLKSDFDLPKDTNEACWDGYKQQGLKKKGNRMVPNCVPEENEVDEERKPLSLQQRLARGRMLRRIAPKLKRMRDIRRKRMADQPRLERRARKTAIKFLRKRVAGERGKNYADLSPSEKITVDRLVIKKLPMVKTLARRLLPSVRKQEMERLKKARETKEEIEIDEQKVAQDPDIKDREGTQPKKYFSGLKRTVKTARDAQFKAGAEKDSSDPSAYPDKHAGDAGVETKPSKHTLKYKKMFGENEEQKRAKEEIKKEKELDKIKHDRMLDRARMTDTTAKNKQTEEFDLDELTYQGNIGAMETIKFQKIATDKEKQLLKTLIKNGNNKLAWQLIQKVTKTKLQGKDFDEEFEISESAESALKKKAEKSGISYGTLKKVYDRGMAAWRTGHRPGATQQQWAFARVNSYITKGKGTYHGADKDLRENDIETNHSELKTFAQMREATYQGKKVPLNKPMPGDVKKSKVYVDPDGDGVAKKVNFGDPNMTIKKNIPARRKSFRARHNCDNPGPKDKPRYWSCKAW